MLVQAGCGVMGVTCGEREVVGEEVGVHGGGHEDHAQRGLALQQVAQDDEQEVGVHVALVHLAAGIQANCKTHLLIELIRGFRDATYH